MTLKDEALVTEDRPPHPVATYLRLLWADKFATAAAVFLLVVVLSAILGPALFGKASLAMNLRGRNLAPFHLEHGWLMILGADSLGRPILARIIVAAQNTMTIAFLAVLCAAVAGGFLGLVAGYSRTRLSKSERDAAGSRPAKARRIPRRTSSLTRTPRRFGSTPCTLRIRRSGRAPSSGGPSETATRTRG